MQVPKQQGTYKIIVKHHEANIYLTSDDPKSMDLVKDESSLPSELKNKLNNIRRKLVIGAKKQNKKSNKKLINNMEEEMFSYF